MLKTAHGFSLISVMAGILLASVSLIGMISSFKATVALGKEFFTYQTTNLPMLRTYHFLSQAMEAVDSNRFIQPVIHKNGAITFTNGVPNRVLLSSTALRPKAGSDAFTTIEIDPRYFYTVKRCTPSGKFSATYSVCARGAKHTPLKEEKTFAGVSPDSITELTGEKKFKSACGKLSLKLEPSMSLNDPAGHNPCAILKLLPILQHSTIYLSYSSEVRYLSHRGASNIENQPLTGPSLDSIQLESTQPLSGIQVLKVKLLSKSGASKTFTFNHHLSRTQAWSFLFNPS